MEILSLTKLRNIRDLGGIINSDGKTIRKNCFIRSSSLFKLNSKDIEILKNEYKLNTIIDLRTKREVEEKPEINIDKVNYYHMPVLNDSVAGLSHEKKVSSLKSLKLMPPMEKMYINMVSDDCLENVCVILRKILTLKDNEYSVLFHCTAGKDRTGIIAALILEILNVNREKVIQEYMFTNRFTKAKAKFIYLGLMIVKFNHKFANKIRLYYISKQEYIKSSLESLEKEYGSIKDFFIKKVGFSEEDIEKIQKRFLV